MSITTPKPDSIYQWQFWIDRGGTFTDIVAQRSDGKLVLHKLLSEHPERYTDAAIQGIRDILAVSSNAPLPSEQIAAVRMGTTVATNALLERKGDRTVLVITKGFKDALRIGYQNRPHIFARQIVLPEVLYEGVIEAHERYSASGEELIPLDRELLQEDLQAAFVTGIRACAIAFMHGYRYPNHEVQAAEIAQKMGFTQISISHVVSPLMKLIRRGDTTVVDAYLSPILRRYVDQFSSQFHQLDRPDQISQKERSPKPQLMFMQSNGGLVDAQLFQGKDSILSGPAGGIVGAVQTSRMAGFDKIISFDMGGTSTDVAHYAGELERSPQAEVAGVRLSAPMLAIHTVAAGGGSMLSFDGRRYRVGPASAGADPGPACYRRGGPLTVTDANVMLGKLHPEFFPQVFGRDGDRPLDVEIVRQKFAEIANQIQIQVGDRRSLEAVAQGFLEIAVGKMASAIKKISVQRGYDVSEYALCCFGGAGGQHACLIANALGMQQIFIHPYAGVLSAYGMGLADLRLIRERAIESPLTENLILELEKIVLELSREGTITMQSQAYSDLQINRQIDSQNDNQSGIQIHAQVSLRLRYEGTDSALAVDFLNDNFQVLKTKFEQFHHQRYGFIFPEKSLIVEAIAVEIIGRMPTPTEPKCERDRTTPPVAIGTVQMYCEQMYCGHRWQPTQVFKREDLQPGDRITAPAIILDATGTNIIEPGWCAELTAKNYLILQKERTPEPNPKFKPSVDSANIEIDPPAFGTPLNKGSRGGSNSHHETPKPDPVKLEIFNNLFQAIADQMGLTLQNTSMSVNIKERLDFSCAIFDAQGQLVANAPHIPVHLGSMSESVRSLIAACETQKRSLQPGDVYASNNPYNGGTHLPDITVITPVFSEYTSRNSEDAISPEKALFPLFYVASRGHHADIGGISPGSMPPHSSNLDQEGILIDNFLLVDRGQFREQEVLSLLLSHRYPARNPKQNIADLQAQIAANEKGVQELHRMVQQYSLATVQVYMSHIQDNAEECVRDAIAKLGIQISKFGVDLDNGSRIQVAISVDCEQRTAKIDFTGTSRQQNHNFNAPLAVTKAAVLYVFRTLVDDDIPLNAGCLKPIEIIVPQGCMLNPQYPAAVVAGNVETSQAIVNALYGALGVMAAAQGTMNNLTFGSDRYQYYETICGGSGAGADFDGTDAVQTHMTNSRLTDPEVLEWRFPVLLEEFSIRANSGGNGMHRGGNGVVRRIRFRESMSAAILSNHRRIAPFGLAGGQSGAPGRNLYIHADGTLDQLDGTISVQLQAGDILQIETPGGGGYGIVK